MASTGTRPHPQLPGAQPPTPATRIIRLFLSDADENPILGDLAEMFQDSILPNHTSKHATNWYWRQVLLCALPFLWMRIRRRVSRLAVKFGFMHKLFLGILGFYLAKIVFHLLYQLFSLLPISGISSQISRLRISDGVLLFVSGPCSFLNRYYFLKSWQDTIYSVFLFLLFIAFLRKSAGFISVIFSYLILASCILRLAPLMVSLLTAETQMSWIGDVTGSLHPLLQILLALASLTFIAIAIHYSICQICFNAHPISHRISSIISLVILPIVIVQLFMRPTFNHGDYFFNRDYQIVMLIPVLALAVVALLLKYFREPETTPSASCS